MKMKENSMLLFLKGFIFLVCTACFQNQENNQNEKNITSDLFHIPFVSSGEINQPILVIVLHGDAPFNNPSYQYGIARKIAKENKNVIAVGVLRPGYIDNEGNSSKGERGNATGDNYTKEVLGVINSLTSELKIKYNSSKVILVGHSGGAAISANLLSQYPNTYSNALLISCPCDLHLWRKHMKTLQPETQIWDIEVNSLSPIEELSKINSTTEIMVIHGDNDKIVPINIANKYVEKMVANKKNVNFITLENQGHEIAFNKKIFEVIKEIIDER